MYRINRNLDDDDEDEEPTHVGAFPSASVHGRPQQLSILNESPLQLPSVSPSPSPQTQAKMPFFPPPISLLPPTSSTSALALQREKKNTRTQFSPPSPSATLSLVPHASSTSSPVLGSKATPSSGVFKQINISPNFCRQRLALFMFSLVVPLSFVLSLVMSAQSPRSNCTRTPADGVVIPDNEPPECEVKSWPCQAWNCKSRAHNTTTFDMRFTLSLYYLMMICYIGAALLVNRKRRLSRWLRTPVTPYCLTTTFDYGDLLVCLWFLLVLLTQAIYWTKVLLSSGLTSEIIVAKVFGHLVDVASGVLPLLAVRHSALQLIAGLSLERAFRYHRWAGNLCFLLLVIHYVLRVDSFGETPPGIFNTIFMQFNHKFLNDDYSNAFAEISLLGFTILFFLSFSYIRRQFFNLFYVGHLFLPVFWTFGILHSWQFLHFNLPGIFLVLVDQTLRWSSRGKIVEVKKEITGVYSLTIRSTHIVKHFRPGQFVFLFIGGLTWHPFNIVHADQTTGLLRLYIRTLPSDRSEKKESKWMKKITSLAEIEASQYPTVYIDGPFGGYDEIETASVYIFFVAGIGITPVFSIIEMLLQRKPSVQTIKLYWSFRDHEFETLSHFQSILDQAAQRYPTTIVQIFLHHSDPERPTEACLEYSYSSSQARRPSGGSPGNSVPRSRNGSVSSERSGDIQQGVGEDRHTWGDEDHHRPILDRTTLPSSISFDDSVHSENDFILAIAQETDSHHQDIGQLAPPNTRRVTEDLGGNEGDAVIPSANYQRVGTSESPNPPSPRLLSLVIPKSPKLSGITPLTPIPEFKTFDTNDLPEFAPVPEDQVQVERLPRMNIHKVTAELSKELQGVPVNIFVCGPIRYCNDLMRAFRKGNLATTANFYWESFQL